MDEQLRYFEQLTLADVVAAGEFLQDRLAEEGERAIEAEEHVAYRLTCAASALATGATGSLKFHLGRTVEHDLYLDERDRMATWWRIRDGWGTVTELLAPWSSAPGFNRERWSRIYYLNEGDELNTKGLAGLEPAVTVTEVKE